MAKKAHVSVYVASFACSAVLNLFFIVNLYVGGDWKLSWSKEAAAEAEAVAAISCSGHGRAYLDGMVVNGKPICDCNSCYGGPDCSVFLPACAVNADRYPPLSLFLPISISFSRQFRQYIIGFIISNKSYIYIQSIHSFGQVSHIKTLSHLVYVPIDSNQNNKLLKIIIRPSN